MSQESNTTNDTNPKPRLQISRQPAEAPAESGTPASPSSGAELPRFSFSRKKRAEEAPAVPVEQTETPPPSATQPPLKRPPPGAHLTPTQPPADMPVPLTPVKPGVTPAPFAKKPAPARTHWGMMTALLLLLVVAAGEAYIIFAMHDETAAANSTKPPLLVTNVNGKPYEVVNDGAEPPTPAYGFLLNFSPQIASGGDPRLFFDSKTYRIGEMVAPQFGLKWTRIDDQNRELEFTDRQGRRYVKKF
ncbi:MAG TPA: hypothetical protein VHC95_12345 [Opitutales bacterium]|nr:hypothetical protein [Opitutales bacterium]